MEGKQRNKLIGERIYNVLKHSRISQTEMARRMGVTKQLLNAYIKGKHQVPAHVVAFIAGQTNVSADYILGLKNNMVPLNDSSLEGFDDIQESYATLNSNQRQVLLNFLRAFKIN